jgi:hypothetical protein
MASAAGVPVSNSGPDIRVLQGFRCLRDVRGLLARLHDHRDHRNRLLHYDEYAVLLLFYFFNATVTSLRSLQGPTGFEKVRKKLGIRRTSLGSLSEASQVFDPELLRGIFEDLAGRAVAKDGLRRPEGLPGHLDDEADVRGAAVLFPGLGERQGAGRAHSGSTMRLGGSASVLSGRKAGHRCVPTEPDLATNHRGGNSLVPASSLTAHPPDTSVVAATAGPDSCDPGHAVHRRRRVRLGLRMPKEPGVMRWKRRTVRLLAPPGEPERPYRWPSSATPDTRASSARGER